MSKIEKKTLTPKQALFAEKLADGVGQSEAYRDVYSTDETASSVRQQAYALSRHKGVMRRVAELKAAKQSASSDELNRKWVMERLRKEADNTKNSAASRIRALELYGKAHKMFDETVRVEVNQRTAAEVEKELEDRLAAIFPQLAKDVVKDH
jgi:hypothetical protein